MPCGSARLDLARPQAGWLDSAPGASLLAQRVDDYQVGRLNVRGRPGLLLSNIRTALALCWCPPGFEVPVLLDGFAVFAGYLVLDDWIANRDRHDENWAVLRPPTGEPGPAMLAGSFDHASGLGFNLVHGIRHVAEADDEIGATIEALPAGTLLRLVDEPDNEVTSRAVLVSTTGNRRLGYVPDFLLDHLAAVRAGDAAAVRVVHTNGPEAPWPMRLLVRLDGRVDPGYVPFAGPGWGSRWPDPAGPPEWTAGCVPSGSCGCWRR
ncbi:MAG TPA: hypothetical protein VLJ59_10500 [Mycobacteriales bacterium]|nr:hypothetical protein [Mycobacteriales bacterium]